MTVDQLIDKEVFSDNRIQNLRKMASIIKYNKVW